MTQPGGWLDSANREQSAPPEFVFDGKFTSGIAWTHSDQERRRGHWPDEAPGNLLNASKVPTPARRRGRSGPRSGNAVGVCTPPLRGVFYCSPSSAGLQAPSANSHSLGIGPAA
jgi:hypothetical protein